MKRGLWKTKTGEVLAIKDMTESHLRYAMRMLERMKATEDGIAVSVAASIGGDMGSFYAERDAESMCEEDVGERFPKYEELREELARRMNGAIL